MIKAELEIFVGKKSMIIADALKKIDKNSLGVLFIVDDADRLVGALSDGDIRRWLIKTGDLNAGVVSAMNTSPKSLKIDQIESAHSKITKASVTAMPIVDDEMHIIEIIDNRNLEEYEHVNNKLKNVPVVMMAGGKGTRLYPYTKILPKPLIPVGEKPIAEHIIDSFCKFGCNDFYLIVNHKKI